MNNIFIFLAFTAVSVLFYLPSLLSKIYLSGPRYSELKSNVTRIYNFILLTIHLRFAMKGTLPFLGELDRDLFGWISLVMVLAHAFTNPSPPEPITYHPGRRPWWKIFRFKR
ncbi:hypothetical protein RRX38_22320 [Pseudomonas sp. DTU_2021_1001937_2_SI_NGA_ILE_001]|uniref:hypothetical protein n=1 Tax=Pseudomonas sp. DTU_2021_1001937_2_SI_NGA_ILE_001 TaxID=3077589 RepID=UPI0028FC1935|nr:hypothetical protein [Pseudomonas sp. DTU_2021_1001937_2_SI_NGA_ILE_001]WNW13778.1 hypothetical protein RRX38_22320 [Pseudomonas sp. DTU_2021_1001937_2_SI_NGA_ILE_001]